MLISVIVLISSQIFSGICLPDTTSESDQPPGKQPRINCHLRGIKHHFFSSERLHDLLYLETNPITAYILLELMRTCL
ncbi:hypothetical protein C8R47DRAFT_424337 [Mycena vitilis]|nr:hypothetical protein C8R47DRAFT_424337 [Mycena vitilis]